MNFKINRRNKERHVSLGEGAVTAQTVLVQWEILESSALPRTCRFQPSHPTIFGEGDYTAGALGLADLHFVLSASEHGQMKTAPNSSHEEQEENKGNS